MVKEAGNRKCSLFRWNDVPEEPVTDLLSRKIFTGDQIMLAQITLKKGCVVPAHSHENEQISYALSGALKFDVEGQEIIVRGGELLHIPGNVVHAAVALEDTSNVDIFVPPRQDWLDKTDDYLRQK